VFGLVETLRSPALIAPSLVSNAVQGAGYQIAFETTGQAKPIGGLGEMNKHFLDNIFGRVHVACQHHGQFEQVPMMLVIDPPQGFATSPLKFPDKQLIVHYSITHRKWYFYIQFFKYFQ